ncbi:hypothetical protein [Branchiibius sp. NY16-3462-2]|uniref:hypothetical protein n=1 Tax=Branchiibius sp. NY16-3462-2 TaxID=1807500 RepID=UPI0025BF2E1F|nr:hypothetical protein [Branchiibius sp. NY16-3462-2]
MRFRVIGTMAATGALAMTGGAAMACGSGPGGSPGYTCTGGLVPSGTYSNLKITGQCGVADGATITVRGSVWVAANAAFDAQSAPATITVGGNVTASSGSLLGLGCQPASLVGNSAHPCETNPTGASTITVRGSVTAIKAAAVLINGTTVGGNVTALGGGSPEIPWSIKNNTVGRNITVAGQNTEWIGVMFNKVGRNVLLYDIALSDPDPGAPGVFIVRNTIERNLVCYRLTPGVSGGFVPGSVNVVGGVALGQCASLV